MPPNVKETANVVDALATLDVKSVVKSPYLPLTQPSQQPGTEAEDQGEQKRPADEEEEYETAPQGDASYWDWPEEPEQTDLEKKQSLIERILKEEEIRQTLSVSHIEENLIVDATKKSEDKTEEYVTAKDEDGAIGYWDMPSAEVHTAADDNNITTAQHVMDYSHPRQSYWDWDARPLTAKEEKCRLINRILREEEIRVGLMADKIEDSLVLEAARLKRQSDEDVFSADIETDADDYWTWKEETITAPHVGEENNSKSSYWDWPQLSIEEQKQETIRRILKEEEIRQCMAVEQLEEKLRRESQMRDQEGEWQQAVSTGQDGSYWDW